MPSGRMSLYPSSLALDSMGRPRIGLLSWEFAGVGVRLTSGWAVQSVGATAGVAALAIAADGTAYLAFNPADGEGVRLTIASTPGLDWVCE